MHYFPCQPVPQLVKVLIKINQKKNYRLQFWMDVHFANFKTEIDTNLVKSQTIGHFLAAVEIRAVTVASRATMSRCRFTAKPGHVTSHVLVLFLDKKL